MSEKIFVFIKISKYLSLIQKDSVTHMHGLAVVNKCVTKWLTHYLLAELKDKFTILHLD